MPLQTQNIDSTTKNGYTLRLILTENSVNAGANTSNVTWELRLISTYASFQQYRIGRVVRLDGGIKYNVSRSNAKQFSLPKNSYIVLGTYTSDIHHGPDGTKTMTASASMDMQEASYTPGALSLSGSMTLTPIARPAATLTVSPDNTGTIVSDRTDYVQGLSKLSWSIGGTGSSYALAIRWADGTTQTYTGQTGTTPVLTKAGSAEVTATVTASGVTATAKKTVSVLPYGAPTIDLSAWRYDSTTQKKSENGPDVQFKATAGAVGSIGGAVTMVYVVRNESNSTVASGSMTSGETVTVTGLNAEKAYRVTVTATDELGTGASKTVATASSTVTLSLKRGGKGAAFGKHAEKDNTLDVPWNVIGRVMGLGEARGTVADDDDLNDYKEPGVYRIPHGRTRFIRNAPIHYGGTLVVRLGNGQETGLPSGESKYIQQEYIHLRGTQSWTRFYTASGGWRPWQWSRGEKAYRQGNEYRLRVWTGSGYADAVDAQDDDTHMSPWTVSLVDDAFVTACIVYENVRFYPSTGYQSSALVHSNQYFLALPFALEDIALVGNGENGIYVSDVKQNDGPAGVSFRLIAPFSVSSLFTLRLQVTGRLSTMGNPPTDPDTTLYRLNNEEPVTVARSYFNDPDNGDWRTVRSTLVEPGYIYEPHSWNATSYNNLTDESGNGLLECDGFVRMILHGLTYNDSPYVHNGMDGGAVKPNATFDHNALPVNQNDEPWVSRINEVLIGNSSPKTWSGGTVAPVSGALPLKYFGINMRFTYHMLWVWWMQRRIFADASQLRSGDIAFWTDHSNDKTYFDCVSHVALVSVENGVPYLYEVTNYSLPAADVDVPVMQHIPLADKVPQPTCFARPDYST